MTINFEADQEFIFETKSRTWWQCKSQNTFNYLYY